MNWKTFLFAVTAVLILGGVVITKNHQSVISADQTSDALGKLITSVTYTCSGGKSIAAGYFEGQGQLPANPDQPPTPGGSVALTFDDGSVMTLHQTISADGARYANADDSFVFWSKGEGAMILQGGNEKDYTNCINGTLSAPAAIPTK